MKNKLVWFVRVVYLFSHVSEKGVQFPNFQNKPNGERERKLRVCVCVIWFHKKLYANFKWVSNVINVSVNCSFFWFWIRCVRRNSFSPDLRFQFRCSSMPKRTNFEFCWFAHGRIYFYGLGTFYHFHYYSIVRSINLLKQWAIATQQQHQQQPRRQRKHN